MYLCRMYMYIYTHVSLYIEFLQGGGIVMLFNVMHESYVAGRETECLPNERQKTDIEGE